MNSGVGAVTEFKRNINSDNARRKIDERIEALLIEFACCPVSERHSRWAICLLKEESKVFLEHPVSRKAIRNALKNKLRPYKNKYWYIPTREDPEFIACMEDILDVYELPCNTKPPVVYMDEKPYQLFGEARALSGGFWSPPAAHCFILPNGNSGGIASSIHDSVAILFTFSYHSYISAWLFVAAMTILALMQGCSC